MASSDVTIHTSVYKKMGGLIETQYICTCVCIIHTYIHTYDAYIHTYIRMMHTYIHTSYHTYIRIYIHTYIHTHTNTHTNTHTQIRTHTHTLSQVLRGLHNKKIYTMNRKIGPNAGYRGRLGFFECLVVASFPLFCVPCIVKLALIRA